MDEKREVARPVWFDTWLRSPVERNGWAQFDGRMLTASPITFTPISQVDLLFTQEDFDWQRELLKDAAKQAGINTEGLFDR